MLIKKAESDPSFRSLIENQLKNEERARSILENSYVFKIMNSLNQEIAAAKQKLSKKSLFNTKIYEEGKNISWVQETKGSRQR